MRLRLLLLCLAISHLGAQGQTISNSAGGVVIPSTGSALKGDGAGNAIAVTGTGSNCVHADGSSAACSGGGATIPSTTNVLIGDGAGNGASSGHANPAGAFVGTTDTQTLTNKTVDGVSPATFGFLDPTSSVQAQLNTKGAGTVTSIICGTGLTGGTITTTGTCAADSSYFNTKWAQLAAANTFSAGVKNTMQASATTAGFRLVPAADPSAPAAGDCNITLAGRMECWDGSAWQISLSASDLAFSTILAGTNAAALLVGTGGSLDVSGSGTINATSLGGSAAALYAKLASPTFTTPTLGVATATSINKVAITAPATSATLTIANGKTLTASNTLTFTGTDSSSVALGTGGTVVYTANNLGALASTTSAQFAGVISDATGSGLVPLATSPTLTTPKIAQINDANGNAELIMTATASAVDQLTLANSATAAHTVTLSATGTDTNISVNVTPKGNGGLFVPVNGSAGNPVIGIGSANSTTGFYSSGTNHIALAYGGAAGLEFQSGYIALLGSLAFTYYQNNSVGGNANNYAGGIGIYHVANAANNTGKYLSFVEAPGSSSGAGTSAQIPIAVRGLVDTENEGTQLITGGSMNPDCSNWTLTTGWTCDTTNHRINHTVSNTTAITYANALTIVPGRTYDLQVDFLQTVNGSSLSATLGGVTQKLTSLTNSGTVGSGNAIANFHVFITATTNGTLSFTPDTLFGTNNYITNISLKEVQGTLNVGHATVKVRTLTSNETLQNGTYLVSALPTCNAAAEGMRAGATDLLTPTFLTAAVGGGAVHGSVYCTGSQWVTD